MVVWSVWLWCVGWAWRAAEAGVVGCVLAGLGLLLSWAGWQLGLGLRERRYLSLRWTELNVHSWDLRLASPGPARLAALRRLVRWIQAFPANPDDDLWDSLWPRVYRGSCFPELLVGSLFECLLESGAEAAQLLLRISRTAYFALRVSGTPHMAISSRERLFSEASLARLRDFFLASEDGAVQRVFLRLLHLASRRLLLHCRLGRAEPWELPLLHRQGSRIQNFLLHEPFVGKVLGLLRTGDPAYLLREACLVFSELDGGGPHGDQGAFTESWQGYGVQALLRPAMGDLAASFDRLPAGSKTHLLNVAEGRLGVSLSPKYQPTEAEDAVEGRLVPLLRKAAAFSPAALFWLASASSTRDQNHWPSDDLLGRRLRSSVFTVVRKALGDGQLSPGQSWALVAGVANSCRPTLEEDRRFWEEVLRYQLCRLPVTAETRLLACRAFQSLAEELRGTLGWAGGFRLLRRLLSLHQPPCHAPWEYWHTELCGALYKARWLLRPVPAPLVLGEKEARTILLAWREADVAAALRQLCSQPPLPDYDDPRPLAQDLLDIADGLLHDQPLTLHSALAPDFRVAFPLR